jgi:membrane protease YdiL (CAAX protease family)
LIPAIVATIFATRIVEDIPVQSLGLGFHEYWKLNLIAGFSIGGFLLILVVAGAKTFGEFQLDWAPYMNPGRLLLTLGILIVAAAFEELIFRGYPMQVLMKGMGPMACNAHHVDSLWIASRREPELIGSRRVQYNRGRIHVVVGIL